MAYDDGCKNIPESLIIAKQQEDRERANRRKAQQLVEQQEKETRAIVSDLVDKNREKRKATPNAKTWCR